ncbi:YdeI/OmpD-associated family protein [Flavisolibacter ginsengisoli]|jgi:hypothetical protein|uniref:Bacteriocin-protection, YdeI or OmpD-Associated n=1 Tax=Flavisolibacter ginsengisoli DSM 18119 TaxID=1121884 RepID=A0A1M4X4P7_9BACT|nr:YdeI/OmpD-associated family protein [Flavisolibacter ginsengisoli]SHE88440.1 Bacteriocin-protection, YdeI or OmpD-Associated [Flavisolibacter ginsengisoli DSM 18119]
MPAITTAQKFKIKQDDKLLTLHAPESFKSTLGALPTGVTISNNLKTFNQVHWFVQNKAQLEQELDLVIPLIKDDIICWIYYPKATSKIQTDLTRDKGWEALRQHSKMQWISLISFDETWSSFGLRLQTGKERKKETKVKEIFNYIEPLKKLTFLPEDFAAALHKAKKEETFFNSLSFTNRKEYLEWIVSAKKKETRQARIQESITRLSFGWKNPANR